MVRRGEGSDPGGGKRVQRRHVHDLTPNGEESVEFLVNDELFYLAGDLTIPARPDSGMDMRQGPSGPKPKPDANDDELMDQDDDHMEGK